MLNDILVGQKRELAQRLGEPYIERDISFPALDNNLIKVILGPRRVGKSLLAMHVLAATGSFGYVNFDDERLVNLSNFDDLLAAVHQIYNSPKYLLLDEIQNIRSWELLVNRLQRQNIRLVVTGSNAHLLSSELATHLTGRHLPIVLLPFTFGEYRRALLTEHQTSSEIRVMLQQFLETGGMPEPLVTKVERSAYLNTLLDSIIYKDIVKRHRVRAVQGMDHLVRYFLSNCASEYSFKTVSEVSQAASDHTIQKFLHFLRESFLFFTVPRFSPKMKLQIRSPRKMYCIDNGFITSGGFRIMDGVGVLAENAVAARLRQKELEGKHSVYYWKSDKNEEVDFAIWKNQQIDTLVQVCWDISNPKTRQREIRALLKAGAALHCKDLYLLNANEEKEEQAEWFGLKGKIQYRSLGNWLSTY